LNLELTHEQRMLREAAAGALARFDTVANARDARDGGEPLDLWPLAREAGWSGLLVPEEHGGAGLGLYDAMLVLTECGRRLAGSGLIGHLGATLVMARAAGNGDERATAELPALAAGERRAAFVFACPPAGGEDWSVDGGDRLPRLGDGAVDGGAAYLPDADGADLLVVPALDQDGSVVAAAVDSDADGLRVERQLRGDASRPLAAVSLRGAPAERLAAGPAELSEAWHAGQALLAADALGVCEAMLEMGVAYAKDRHAFGRPIGSYQAVKHQLVEILHRTEKLRSLCIYAGLAAEAKPDELALATATARLAGEQAADYATRTCIAVHGGVGATWEHDAPWYWRRAQLSRLLLGGEKAAVERISSEAVARARSGDGSLSLLAA
jgi:alkylation response protein AidB-like acyl-CoA dehydrogenase